MFGACPAWPVPSDVGVGQRCGAGSPACPGDVPAESLGAEEPGAPPEDPGCPLEVDGCAPDPADGLPDDPGWPPDGDCCPLELDGLPDDPDGDELPLGVEDGIWGDGIETLGVVQPPDASASTATRPVHAKFCSLIKDFSAHDGIRACAPHPATHPL